MLPPREAPHVRLTMLECISKWFTITVPPPTAETTAIVSQEGPLHDEVTSGLNAKPGHSPDHLTQPIT